MDALWPFLGNSTAARLALGLPVLQGARGYCLHISSPQSKRIRPSCEASRITEYLSTNRYKEDDSPMCPQTEPWALESQVSQPHADKH